MLARALRGRVGTLLGFRVEMSDDIGRTAMEHAYRRLSGQTERTSITAQKLKAAALAALGQARERIEHDAEWVSTEFDRLAGERTQALPPHPNDR